MATALADFACQWHTSSRGYATTRAPGALADFACQWHTSIQCASATPRIHGIGRLRLPVAHPDKWWI